MRRTILSALSAFSSATAGFRPTVMASATADAGRHFPLPPQSSVRTTLSESDCVNLARSLSERCWRAYEHDSGLKSCRGSFYTGGLGSMCYLRYRLATHPSPASSSSSTDDKWSERHPPSSLLSEALTAADAALKRGTHRHSCSLLEGRISGALAMKCALLSASGKHVEARKAAEEVLRLGRGCRSPVECGDESECEVLYGRAGYLQTLLFVRSVLPTTSGDEREEEDHPAASFGREVAVNTIQTILETGVRTSRHHSSPLPLLWEWHESLYLGAAHGVVGILQTLLCYLPELREAGQRSNLDAVGLVRSTVDKLEDMCFSTTGNLRSSVGRERDKLVHWCHGAPGYVLLLIKSYQVFNDDKYLRRAERIGRDVVYRRGLLRKGVGLCHGISGNAYVFLAVRRGLQLERARREKGEEEAGTEEEKKVDDEWLKMAQLYAGFAVEHLRELEPIPDRPYSLFEGMAGLVSLLLDLTRPDEARFPCYEF